MKLPARGLLALSLVVTFATSSCYKVPNPIPIPVIQSLEQFPFKAYLDSLTAASAVVSYGAGVPHDPSVAHGGSEQAVFAFPFRTSVAGVVTSLAVLEPVSGYSHTVTLWDSASGAVLGQADVPSLNAGHWTSVSLAVQGKAVPILANHGYIVGFNSLADDDALDAGTSGDEIFFIFGAYYTSPDGEQLANMVPFISKTFTFEGEYGTYYNSILDLIAPPFPGGLYTGNNMFGACDIGFIPTP
ncbi:MAG TPA: hypothetical protein VMH27_03270 [Puia sp.]|nr:hypothetical protein [Puia sp.]